MNEYGPERLARTVRAMSRSADSSDSGRGPVDREPSSVYEIITRQMVDDLAREVRDLRRRIDMLLFLVVATIIGDIIMRLTGAAV